MENVKIKFELLKDKKVVVEYFITTGIYFDVLSIVDFTFVAYMDKRKKNVWEIWKVAESISGLSLSSYGNLTQKGAIEDFRVEAKHNSNRIQNKIKKDLLLWGPVNNIA